MKVLWLCNMMLPIISEQLNRSVTNGGGWLTGLLNDLKKNDNVKLTVCFPVYGEKKIIKGNCDNILFYGFPKKNVNPTIYEKNVEQDLKSILQEVNPDVIHIWGTEFPHSLSMMNVCDSNKAVISIQGLCSAISGHYMAFLPYKVQRRYTFRDFVKNDNLKKQQENFIKRGQFEIDTIKKSQNVIGRTTWDRVLVKQINPAIDYYFANETLRDVFYNSKWDVHKCERYSIFLSQSIYPIKGLHLMLEAMNLIVKIYPQAHLYIAGENIAKSDELKSKLRLGSYGKYILQLIKKFNLDHCVTFTGNLNEKEMCEMMLKSHVFVCPSAIENSPNSLGEAMLLGVPSVASYVGGIPDMLKHREEGFLYQADAAYMLADYICEIFRDDSLALKFSSNAAIRAQKTHNRKNNCETIIDIYESIIRKR